MFLFLSFVIAFALFASVLAHPGSTADKSSYLTFTTYDKDHATTGSTPIIIQGIKTSTFGYDGQTAYSGAGDVVTYSTTYPAPGQIGVVFNRYNVAEVTDLTSTSTPNSQIFVGAADTVIDWSSIPGYPDEDNKVVVSESGFKVPNSPGLLLTLYNNDNKGKDACNNAEGYGASSYSDASVAGYQWYPVGYCSDATFFITHNNQNTDYFKTTLNADGSLTITQYASEADCQANQNAGNTLNVLTGNSWCEVDWPNATPAVNTFDFGPGLAANSLYHVSAQYVSGATPKPAPKVKITKSPLYLKKGKKMAL